MSNWITYVMPLIWMLNNNSRILKIYLDFDGTVVEHAYPEIGALNPGSIDVVLLLHQAGHEIILNTYRSDLNDGSLEEAITFLNERLSFTIEEFTQLKINPENWDLEKAINKGILFIDDIAPEIPLINNIDLPYGKMVCWESVGDSLREFGVL